jgi:hypothetical protein
MVLNRHRAHKIGRTLGNELECRAHGPHRCRPAGMTHPPPPA